MIKKINSNFIWQPLLATLVMTLLLFTLNEFATSKIIWAVGAGSMASSCFIVFSKPSNIVSWPSKIIGGYVIGILAGEFIRLIIVQAMGLKSGFLGVPHFPMLAVFAAISVGLSIFLMNILEFQHPPAAGMALVLVLEPHDYHVLFVILTAAVLLAFIRRMLFHSLKDLY